jgi:hypothetical protein
LVVTELAAVSLLDDDEPLEGDEPLDSLEPELLDSELEDSEPLDVEPVDVSLPLELVRDPLADVDSDFSAAAFLPAAFFAAAVRAAADCEVLAVFAPVLATTVRAVRLADAVSAGSFPDASCT